VWQSPDPILGRYLNGEPNDGVFSPANLALFTYVGNNPLKRTDPKGLAFGLDDLIGAGLGAVVGVGVEIGKDLLTGEKITAGGIAGAAVGGALLGEGMSVYETRFQFDTFGRMLRITYPDGEVVTNTYDSGGKATEVALRSQGIREGVFKTAVQVGEETITVTGKIVEGAVRIGTAYVPPVVP